MSCRALFFVAGLLIGPAVFAADCPNPLRCATTTPVCKPNETETSDDDDNVANDEPILKSKEAIRSSNGETTLRGNAEVRQGNRVLRAEEINRSPTGDIRIPGKVELSDPHLALSGEGATVDPAAGTALFEGTTFAIPDRAGHGSARQIRLSASGTVDLNDVRYTTCPTPNPDWELKIRNLHIDQRARVGSGSGARVDFKGFPILYVPYISFPVGDEPKSGFLSPEPGHTSRSGWQLAVPWYWRIADNYDATFTPTWYSSRGIDTGGEFGFLTGNSKGTVNMNYLADDRQTGDDRTFAKLTEQTDFNSRLRFNAAAINVGDDYWFEDFGSGAYHSIVALPRTAEIIYRGDEWSLSARAQNFQIIDPEIAPTDRPYTILPQVLLEGFFPDRPLGTTVAIGAEFVAFQPNTARRVDNDPEVLRFDVEPQLRLPLQTNGMYLEPAASFRYTAYRLSTNDDRETLSRSAPILSLDGGMVFERESGRADSRVMQTLEPRFLYAYVPFRDQSMLPVLDTATPNFNLVQLFRTTRYVGADRLGDVNHVALGMTSRWFGTDGRQILSATLGELYRFEDEHVGLPGEPLNRNGTSDVVGELDLNAYRHWSAHVGVQWDPVESRNERTEFGFQYRPDIGKVVNVAYRYRRRNTLAQQSTPTQTEREGLQQVDASAAWPIGSAWSVYGRMVYSIKDDKAIERLGGFEYRSCCWGVRLMARRSVSSIAGESEWEIKAQLELTGLSNVGHPVDTFLAQSIQGYSAARNDFSSTP